MIVDLVSPCAHQNNKSFPWSCKRFASAEPGPNFILPQLYSRSYVYSTPQKPEWGLLDEGWCARNDIGGGNEPEWFKKLGKTYITIAKTQRIPSQQQDLFTVSENCVNQAMGNPRAMAINGGCVTREQFFITEGAPQES